MLTGRTPIQAGCELFGSASAADLGDQPMLEASGGGLPRGTRTLPMFPSTKPDLCAGFYKDTEAAFDAMARKSVPELDELLAIAPGSAGAACASWLG